MTKFNDKITESLETTEKLLFCKALKLYETKEFKKGLKLCNTILTSTNGANHAETIALKGVFLSCTGYYEEGYNLCKQGIARDLNSYMCWHILGLVERDRRNYASSLACFKTASKRNPENTQILRDLGNLQLQQEDYFGNMDTREKLYNLQSDNIMNTIAYAYSCYLCKQYKKSYEILENAEKIHVTFHSQLSPQELNNLVLFEAELLLQMKKFDTVTEFVNENEGKFLDKENLLRILATANEWNGKYDVAAEKYLQLLLLMPNNDEYIDKYVDNFKKMESCSKISSIHDSINPIPNNNNDLMDSCYDDDTKIDRSNNIDSSKNCPKLIYKSLMNYIPNSLLLKQRYMNLASLFEFEEIIDDYLDVSIKKNIPQAINTLKQIYDNDIEGKVDVIQEKLLNLIDLYENKPDSQKWCYYYMAMHYKLIDCLDQGLISLKECLRIDSCMHDAIILLAKIYRSVNNFECANCVMKYVSDIVPSDRYMNSITGKYFFYVDNNELADRYLQRFSRNGENIDDYMREIQNLWYRVHKATLFYRETRFFDALYHVRIAECHFEQFTFDRVDFHFYCIRRFLLRPHENLLHLDENLKCSKFHWRLVVIAARTLIKIYRIVSSATDHPHLGNTQCNIDNDNCSNNVESRLSTNKQKKQERYKKLKELKKDNRQNGEFDASNFNTKHIPIKKQTNCCPKKHITDTPEKLKQFYSNKSNLPKLVNELNNLAGFLHTNFNNKFKTQSILFEIYLTTKNNDKLYDSYQQMFSIQPNHFKLFWYEIRMLKYFISNNDTITSELRNTILSYLPITELNENKFNIYVSLKLSDYVKKYHQNPWNMITYILVATQLNIFPFIEPTAVTLFDQLSNEPDVFTYTEMTKFRKFVSKYLPNRLDKLDCIISEWYPTMFHCKDIIDYLN